MFNPMGVSDVLFAIQSISGIFVMCVRHYIFCFVLWQLGQLFIADLNGFLVVILCLFVSHDFTVVGFVY